MTNCGSEFAILKKLSVPLHQKFNLEIACNGIILLSKLDMAEVAIVSLFNDVKNVQKIWLGYTVINSEISNFQDKNKCKHLLELLRDNTTQLANNFLKISQPHVFSTTFILVNKTIASIISFIVLNKLNSQAEYLLNQINIENKISFVLNSIDICEFIKDFSEEFIEDFSVNTFVAIFNYKLITNPLQRILQESMEIILNCEKAELAMIKPENFKLGKWINLIGMGNLIIETQLLDGIVKTIELFWRSIILTLLYHYLQITKNSNLLKLGITFIRGSIFDLKYLKHGMNILKIYNYSSLNPNSELAKDLFNVLGVYIDTTNQETLLNSISIVFKL